jgi:predicted HicB family RNase H-like nuclease
LLKPMDYKGYIAEFTFDEKRELFLGRVSNIRDVVTFQAKSIANLRYAFKDAVNEYIEWSKKYGNEPEKPSPVIPVEVHIPDAV